MRAQKNIPEQLKLSDFDDKSLLILDDDDPLRGRLARAMEKKGFLVKEAKTVAEGLNIVKSSPSPDLYSVFSFSIKLIIIIKK